MLLIPIFTNEDNDQFSSKKLYLLEFSWSLKFAQLIPKQQYEFCLTTLLISELTSREMRKITSYVVDILDASI